MWWLTRPATGSARCLNRVLLRVHRRQRCRTRGLARERSLCDTRADARNWCPCTRCLTNVQTHAVTRKVERPVTQSDTGNARDLKCALLRARGRTRCRTRGLGRNTLAATRAETCATHAMSLERADSCIVALKVKRTVAHAAGHWQRTRPGSRVLHVHRCKRCSARGLARERSRGNTRADVAYVRTEVHTLCTARIMHDAPTAAPLESPVTYLVPIRRASEAPAPISTHMSHAPRGVVGKLLSGIISASTLCSPSPFACSRNGSLGEAGGLSRPHVSGPLPRNGLSVPLAAGERLDPLDG